MNKTIAFHLNQMSERGTEISTFDYAKFNQLLLGNRSIIIASRKKIFNSMEKFFIKFLVKLNFIQEGNIKIFSKRQRSTYAKFTKNFKVFFYDCPSEIDLICKDNNVDYFYAQKYGNKDQIMSNYGKNLVHVVFMSNETHGDKYLYISPWLAKTMTGNSNLHVPYIVHDSHKDLSNNIRKDFNIYKNDTVISSYGGKRVFDIEFAKDAVKEILDVRNDLVFMFLNIEPFYKHPRIHFLPRSTDQIYKSKFINSSDYMIHARSRGETFGLAIAEFSARNKPIITYSGSPEKAHLDFLNNKCFKYSSKNSLYDMLINLNKNKLSKEKDFYNCYSKKFKPEIVMKLFQEKFLA